MTTTTRSGRARVGVLLSGGGRTLENLARKVAEGTLPVEIVVAISSHRGVKGLDRAREAGIPAVLVDYREHDGAAFQERIHATLEEARVEWIVLAGFVRHLKLPPRFVWRALNIHPALLPAFGGTGFYGDRVHRAVLESGARFSGCTVHFVTDAYDSGPIILQRVVPILQNDTPHTLAARVFEEECIAYPEALKLCVEGRVTVEGPRVILKDS